MLCLHRSHRNLISTSHLEKRVEGPFFIALVLAVLRRFPLSLLSLLRAKR